MTSICFIRHGETDWNAVGRLQGRTDIPLNNKGRKQAKQCGAYLHKQKFDVVITSPLKRAKETAEIINDYLQLPLIEMNEFIERSFGDAEGMTYEERLEKYQDENLPNQEEQAVLHHRILTALEKVKQLYPEKRIILVSHGAVINAMLSILSNGEIGGRKTPLLNGCFNTIYYHQEQWEIQDYNRVEHLTPTHETINP
ncbi:histidine phosphatase family protein [Oceanobacillus salinisoli]|uniref:histidine phosphatase family protein n=1 Tax=Oceanobacillus salinisoli TaxID=2678611 RepID=UPI0012E0FC48|nr:histidine phosphatase family protein [Oceanobacillus salinisoli]